MKKTFHSVLGAYLLFSLFGCAGSDDGVFSFSNKFAFDQYSVNDLPPEIALTWLEKMPRVHGPNPYGGLGTYPPPCSYSEQGIKNSEGTILPYSSWKLYYPKVVSDTYGFQPFVIGELKLQASFLDKGCYAYIKKSSTTNTDLPNVLKETRTEVEKTITALATMGVNIPEEFIK